MDEIQFIIFNFAVWIHQDWVIIWIDNLISSWSNRKEREQKPSLRRKIQYQTMYCAKEMIKTARTSVQSFYNLRTHEKKDGKKSDFDRFFY